MIESIGNYIAKESYGFDSRKVESDLADIRPRLTKLDLRGAEIDIAQAQRTDTTIFNDTIDLLEHMAQLHVNDPGHQQDAEVIKCVVQLLGKARDEALKLCNENPELIPQYRVCYRDAFKPVAADLIIRSLQRTPLFSSSSPFSPATSASEQPVS